MNAKVIIISLFIIAIMKSASIYGDDIGTVTQSLKLAPGSFAHHRVIDSLSCPFDEVMVGVHIGKEQAICASLNFGYTISKRHTDPKRGTQVSSDPEMHGCPKDFFVQRLEKWAYNDEELWCVSLKNKDGIPLSTENCLHDGRGKSNDGTQSTIYGLSPKMHVCPEGYAMRGIHRADNDLYCCK